MNSQIEEASNKVIGAAIEVHRLLGPGYLERSTKKLWLLN